MDYQEFKKNSVAQFHMPFVIKLEFLSIKDVIKTIEHGEGKYKDSHNIQIQKDFINAQMEMLKNYEALFNKSDTEENYYLLTKQLGAVKFLFSYFDNVGRNLHAKELKQMISKTNIKRINN